jgi:hypothetical protein
VPAIKTTATKPANIRDVMLSSPHQNSDNIDAGLEQTAAASQWGKDRTNDHLDA